MGMGMTVKLLAVLGCVCLATGVCAGQAEAGVEIQSVAHATTPQLSSHVPFQPGWQPGARPRIIHRPKRPGGGGSGGGTGGGSWSDSDLQTASVATKFTTGSVFQGQGFAGAIPPDPNISVGLDPSGNTQIVQVVNTSYAIYNTSGSQLAGGGDLGGAIFSSLPMTANCNANADGGDPIVLWDKFDKRWLISQLAYNSDFTQNDFCLAISNSADATGTYEVYDIPFGSSVPDYPKLGVWGDGIYFSANMFHIKVNPFTGATSSTFLGARACSFPRPGGATPPATITFTCSGGNTSIYNILPGDIDGSTLAPSGSDYYLQFVNNLSTTSGNQLTLYQFKSGKLVALGNLSVGTFHDACGGGVCVPQLGTTQQLDSLGDRLMYRLSYRNYGSYQAMVVNHSVQVSSANHQTGIRWYQLCNQNAAVPFYVCAQSTFSPDTTTSRWMGSIAQNSVGDLGLGYSTSSSSMYPSVAVTGLQKGVDSGMETESVIYSGPNFQDTYDRWGDYSSMAVDPHDDCTFWYTTEYSTPPNILGIFNFFWGTVIGSFHFPNCTANP